MTFACPAITLAVDFRIHNADIFHRAALDKSEQALCHLIGIDAHTGDGMEAAVEGPAELILFAANRRVVVFPGQNQVVRQKIELPFRVFFPEESSSRKNLTQTFDQTRRASSSKSATLVMR